MGIERWLSFGVQALLTLGVIGLGLVMIGVALRWGGHDLNAWRLAWRGQRWPVATGTVTRSEIEVTGLGRRAAHTPVIAYQYEVDGRRYIGTRLGFTTAGWFSVRSQAEEALAPYPLGATVQVYHDPLRPEIATLERRYPRNQAGAGCVYTLLLGSGTLIVAASLGGLAALARTVFGR